MSKEVSTSSTLAGRVVASSFASMNPARRSEIESARHPSTLFGARPSAKLVLFAFA